MATYHFSIKAGSRGTGASGKAHADYISRDGQYAHKGDLETAWSANVPAWASTGSDFFAAADENERANGTVYREIELALPRELTPGQREELVDQFCQDTFGDRHVYKVAIHNPQAAIEGGEQPHAHIMFSDRQLDGHERDRETFFKRANSAEPEKGGAKKAEIWSGKDRGQHVEALRENWGKAVNVAYERANRPERVDHRSLESQGITRAPEPHLGPHLAAGPAGDHLQGVRQDRERVADLDRQIAGIDQIQQVFVAEPVQPTPAPEPEKPVQEAVRPVERPVFEPVKSKPEPPPSPVDQVQQINDRQHQLFDQIHQIENQYRQGLPDYQAKIKTVQAEVSEAVRVERIAGKELDAWAKYGEERGWKQGQSFQRPTGMFAGKEKEAFDRWKADYDQKAEKSLKATQTRIGVERSVERKVQNIRQEQGGKEAEIRKRIEADPRIAEARKEIMKGMDQKERIQHPERSQSRSRDRGGIDMDF